MYRSNRCDLDGGTDGASGRDPVLLPYRSLIEVPWHNHALWYYNYLSSRTRAPLSVQAVIGTSKVVGTEAERRGAWMSGMSGRHLKKPPFSEEGKEGKPAFGVDEKPTNPGRNWGGKPTGCSMKNLPTQRELRRKIERETDEKTLETNNKQREKPTDRSMKNLLTQWGKTDPKFEPLGYCFLAFLLKPWSGRPRLGLVLRGQAVEPLLVKTIVGALLIREAVLTRGKRWDRSIKNLLT